MGKGVCVCVVMMGNSVCMYMARNVCMLGRCEKDAHYTCAYVFFIPLDFHTLCNFSKKRPLSVHMPLVVTRIRALNLARRCCVGVWERERLYMCGGA